MDLKVNIEQELWEAIEKNYQNESYSSAILDAMHLLTDTIRNKTGLEGDGASLIGQAFGSDNPKIQLNKLQTESEKNVQKGLQDILRGLYTAIRNPRSHDKHSDTKEDADSIIYFIGYLLKIIGKSKMNFEIETFLQQRVFEEYYVQDEEYSELLVNEIPKRKRVDVAISVILEPVKGDVYKLKYFLEALFNKLEENEILQVYKVVSEVLKYKTLDDAIHRFLHILPSKYWNRIDKVAKIRIENMLFKDVKSGKYDISNKKCSSGVFGTWIETEHLSNFENIDSWTSMIVNKLKKDDAEGKEYIEKYFWYKICQVNYNDINFELRYYFKNGLKNKDKEIIDKMEFQIMFDEKHPWWKVFEDELKDYPDIKVCEEAFLF